MNEKLEFFVFLKCLRCPQPQSIIHTTGGMRRRDRRKVVQTKRQNLGRNSNKILYRPTNFFFGNGNKNKQQTLDSTKPERSNAKTVKFIHTSGKRDFPDGQTNHMTSIVFEQIFYLLENTIQTKVTKSTPFYLCAQKFYYIKIKSDTF